MCIPICWGGRGGGGEGEEAGGREGGVLISCKPFVLAVLLFGIQPIKSHHYNGGQEDSVTSRSTD